MKMARSPAAKGTNIDKGEFLNELLVIIIIIVIFDILFIRKFNKGESVTIERVHCVVYSSEREKGGGIGWLFAT